MLNVKSQHGLFGQIVDNSRAINNLALKELNNCSLYQFMSQSTLAIWLVIVLGPKIMSTAMFTQFGEDLEENCLPEKAEKANLANF